MLNADDVNAFEKLKQEALSLLLLLKGDILPVVDQQLYLNKDGMWSTRLGGRNCLLGDLPIRELLKAFVFAVSGIEPTDEQVDDDELLVLERFTDHIRQAVDELNELRIIPQK